MKIRQAAEADYEGIHALVQKAFETAKVSSGTEQDFVLELRQGNHIPALELVAEEGGALIGHVMLTGITIRNGGAETESLLLAPLSVALERRNAGVGAALMREGLGRAKALGHASVILVGDPAYYARFGFRPAAPISYPGVPGEYTLAHELVPGTLAGVAGSVA